MSKVVCISMARMTSSRLAGKQMLEAGGRPLIEHHIERLKRAKKIDEIYLATTINKADDVLKIFCEAKNVKCFRGSEEDVLSRYFQCAKLANADIIVRVTGDCPLIDPDLVDQVVDQFVKDPQCDCAHLDIFKFPRGFDCEVFSRKTLSEAYHEAKLPSEREHVTSFIYSHPERYKISPFTMEDNYSDLRLCVDEQEDLEFIQKIVDFFGENINEVSWREIIALIEQNPDLKAINSHIVQNTL